jgi:alkanesulfonate monooxygenase SsuD/methylene tetrahydromethanopterin reductase-like flavin-dependent oxidoreductase (luciferase family)
VLSGGRVVFGAGIGGIASEFTAFGEDADARTRADQLDEGLEVLRRLWSGDRVDHHGRHYTVDGVTLAPRPAQEQVPIWIGGNSTRALRRAPRFDGWAADTTNQVGMSKTPGDVERALVTVREARGHLDGFDVAVMGHADHADPGPYAAAGATWWLENVHDLRGSVEEMLALVRRGPPG